MAKNDRAELEKMDSTIGETPREGSNEVASCLTGTDITEIRCVRCRLVRPLVGACPYCERFMFDGPHERFDAERRWLGFYTRVWRKEAGSARGAIICETGA